MEEYKGMKVGDLITTYNKGIFRLIKITRRIVSQDLHDRYPSAYPAVGQDYSPLFDYEPVCDSFGKKYKSKRIGQCDASYCNPASLYLESQRKILKDLESIIL